MRIFLLIISCCCLNLLAAQEKSAILRKRLENIDSVVNRVMDDWKIAGLSIGVVYKNELIFAKGFGYRDVEKKLPVTAKTIFPIASCTKAFTAMLVGMAADKKLLDINKPVHTYFPELEFYTPQLTSMVTAKDMMTHRTGLPRHDWVTHSKIPLPMDTVIRRIRYLEPSKGIREEVLYTNLQYTALGELVKKLAAKTWSQQIEEQIFDPLEMNESSTAFSDLLKSTEYSRGYYSRNDSFIVGVSSTEGHNAAGSINSSVTDMAQWLIAWINGGIYKNKQVLPAGFAIEAATPQMSTPSRPNPLFPSYPDAFFGDMGYGWVIDSYRGHFHVQHSGDLPLYSSNTAFFPTDSIGIVVLVNKFNATVPEMISFYIADRLLDLPVKNWNDLLLTLQKKRSANNSSPVSTAAINKAAPTYPLAEYAGVYRHPGYGIIRITMEQGKLSATHNDQPFSFIHETADEFKANVPNGRLRFVQKQGKISGLSGSFEKGISDIFFERIEKQ